MVAAGNLYPINKQAHKMLVVFTVDGHRSVKRLMDGATSHVHP